MPVSREDVDKIMAKIAAGDAPSADELAVLDQASTEEPEAEAESNE